MHVSYDTVSVHFFTDYFVSNGGTYDPISGLGKPDHHIRLKSSQHKRFVTNDLDSNDKKNLLYGLHHARHLDDNHQGGHHTNKAADESHDEEDQNEKTKTKESEEGEEIQRAKARIRKHCNPPDHKVSGAEGTGFLIKKICCLSTAQPLYKLSVLNIY